MRFFLAAVVMFLGGSGLVGCETAGKSDADLRPVDLRVRVLECDRDSSLGAALSANAGVQAGEAFTVGTWPKASVDPLLAGNVFVLGTSKRMPTYELASFQLVYLGNVSDKSDPLYGQQGGGRLSGFFVRKSDGNEEPVRFEMKLNSRHQLETDGWELERIEYGGDISPDDYLIAFRPFVRYDGREQFLIVTVETGAEQ